MIEYTPPFRGIGIGWTERSRGLHLEYTGLPTTDSEPSSAHLEQRGSGPAHGTAIPYAIAVFGRDGSPELFRPFSFRSGRTVPLLVDHDRSSRVGTAELVNTPGGLEFRASLLPCAQRLIGPRRSVSPAFRVNRDTTHGDLRIILEATIDELSICARGRYWPHTSFNLDAAVAATWPPADAAVA